MNLDLEPLIDHVTDALYESIRPEGEGWDDLPQEDKDNIRTGATISIQATTEWFAKEGIALLPPGVMKAPQSREEAQAMMAAGMAWIRANPEKLVTPPAPAILLPGINDGWSNR